MREVQAFVLRAVLTDFLNSCPTERAVLGRFARKNPHLCAESFMI